MNVYPDEEAGVYGRIVVGSSRKRSRRPRLISGKRRRTKEALVEAIGEAPSVVKPRDAAGWFAHCGYELRDQYSSIPLSEVRG
jgi:hypothetical protein